MENSWKYKFYHMLSTSESLCDEPAELAYEYKSKYLPKNIYRYRSLNKIDREKQNLENDKLYLASPDDFNDPYDCACKINNNLVIYYECTFFYLMLYAKKNTGIFRRSLLDYRSMIQSCSHYRKSYLKKYKEHHSIPGYDEIISNAKDNILISCFSETYNSVLMWSHYANEHKGICIEYDLHALDDNKRSIFNKRMHPVIYSNTVADITQVAIDTIFKSPPENIITYMLIKPAIYKAIDWSYEKEWRIILPKIQNREIETPTPSKIILGARISEDDEEWVRKLCTERSIKVVKAVHSNIYHSMNLV